MATVPSVISSIINGCRSGNVPVCVQIAMVVAICGSFSSKAQGDLLYCHTWKNELFTWPIDFMFLTILLELSEYTQEGPS